MDVATSANEILTSAIVFRALMNCAGLVILAHDAEPSARMLGSGAMRMLKRLVPFALLCAAMVAEKVYGLRFYFDIVAAVALFSAYLLWTRRLGVRNSIYLAVVMFLCADFCVALANSLYLHTPAFTSPAQGILIELVYALLMVGVCMLMRAWAPKRRDQSPPMRGFVALLLALLPYVVLRSSTMIYTADSQDSLTMEVLLLLSIMATFGAVAGNYSALLAASERERRVQLEAQMRDRERRYQVRRQTIEEVNRRYHDLVKYARAYDRSQGAEGLGDYLQQKMTQDLDPSSLYQTGNDALDEVLWEAGDACARQGLRFIPAVDMDARALRFMQPFDVHALIGNALDNAIEAAAKIPAEQEELREVRLRLAQVGQMAFVRVTNHFAEPPQETAGQLRTTKADTELHGFGMGNMRRCAEAYGGSVRHEVRGSAFVLTAMIPLPEGSAPQKADA